MGCGASANKYIEEGGQAEAEKPAAKDVKVKPDAAPEAEKPAKGVKVTPDAAPEAADAGQDLPPEANCIEQSAAESDDDDDPLPPGKATKLAEGVIVYSDRDPEKFQFTYVIRNAKMSTLVFTLDATKSENMGAEGWEEGGQKATAEVPPMSNLTLGTLKRTDPHLGCKMCIGFSWLHKPLDKTEFNELNAPRVAERKELGEQLQAQGVVTSKLQSAQAIEDALRAMDADHFVDMEFFPGDEALYTDPSDASNDPVVWKRPKEFLKHPENVSVFAGGVQPADVKQGALGDCWFLSTLAGLAEYPYLLKSCFVTKEASDLGVYEIRCFKNGKETTVIVDDYFPCNPATGKPCYTKAKGGELWPMVLEKAWAKLHGSYKRIEAGIPMNAMMDLTGGTGRVYTFSREQERIDSGEFFHMMVECTHKEYIMAAGTPGQDDMTTSTEERPTGGIVPGHAYTLLGAKEANDVRLVNLRNPWGEFEWEGDWSDKSDLWTPEMVEAFQPTLGQHDGKFWMSDTDFFAHFHDFNVVYFGGHMGRNWAVSRTELTTTAAEFCDEVVEFTVENPTEAFVTVLQRDVRIQGTPPYIELAFAVYGPYSDNGVPKTEVLRSHDWKTRELVEEIGDNEPFEPGTYAVAVFNPNKVEGVPAMLIIHMCKDQQNIPSTSSKMLDDDMRRQLVLCTAVKSENSRTYDYELFETSGTFLPNGGYALAAKNTGDTEVEVNFDFEECEGYTLHGSEEMKLSVNLEVHDGMQFVAEFIPVGDAKKFTYSLSYSRRAS